MLALFGLVDWPAGLLVLPLSLLGGILFAALGLVTTAIVPKIDSFNLPIFLLILPMFTFSGTFFPVDVLPGWAETIAWALPLTHLSLLVRGAFLGWFPDSWPWSVAVLTALALASSVLALHLMRRRLVK
jgi:lipooligosaccharide transport system permease protein